MDLICNASLYFFINIKKMFVLKLISNIIILHFSNYLYSPLRFITVFFSVVVFVENWKQMHIHFHFHCSHHLHRHTYVSFNNLPISNSFNLQYYLEFVLFALFLFVCFFWLNFKSSYCCWINCCCWSLCLCFCCTFLVVKNNFNIFQFFF